jgi:hypothetical protein
VEGSRSVEGLAQVPQGPEPTFGVPCPMLRSSPVPLPKSEPLLLTLCVHPLMPQYQSARALSLVLGCITRPFVLGRNVLFSRRATMGPLAKNHWVRRNRDCEDLD